MILPTHKTSITYIEHCKIVAVDNKLAYVRRKDAIEKHYSIPYGNTNVILLGPGTSLTQQAAFFLSSEGVLIGFVGGGNTPLYFASQSEYRPTEFMQAWVKIWEQELSRLNAAKYLQLKRIEFIRKIYNKHYSYLNINNICESFKKNIILAPNNQQLMGFEANFVKSLYKLWADNFEVKFKRVPQGDTIANGFIDQGNYLAYGLAASSLWVLGISHSFAVSHGQTRRGALVFDFADLIKDSTIMPLAFESAQNKLEASQFRKEATAFLEDSGALKYIFECATSLCTEYTQVINGDILKPLI